MASILDIEAAQRGLNGSLGLVQMVLSQMKTAVDNADPDRISECWMGLRADGVIIMGQIQRMRDGIAAQKAEELARKTRIDAQMAAANDDSLRELLAESNGGNES